MSSPKAGISLVDLFSRLGALILVDMLKVLHMLQGVLVHGRESGKIEIDVCVYTIYKCIHVCININK